MTSRMARPALLILAGLFLALGLAAWIGPISGRRRAEYRARAESFAWGEAALLQQVADKLAEARKVESDSPDGPARAAHLREEAERLARLGAWHVQLEQKYAWAADHPWAKLPPDPAPPR